MLSFWRNLARDVLRASTDPFVGGSSRGRVQEEDNDNDADEEGDDAKLALLLHEVATARTTTARAMRLVSAAYKVRSALRARHMESLDDLASWLHAMFPDNAEEKCTPPSATTTTTTTTMPAARVTLQARAPDQALGGPRRIAVFCDGTGNRIDDETPTNIALLYSVVSTAFAPDNVQCLYFEGVGLGSSADYAIAYSLPAKLTDIYCAVCAAVGDGAVQLDIFGFSRGALLARALAHLIATRGIVPGTQAARESEVCRFIAGERENATMKTSFVPIAFLGLFDTVPGVSDARVHALGAHLPRAILTRKGPGGIDRSCHILARDTTYLFENISLHDASRRNNSLENLHSRHVEFRLPGDHCNIGGGWDSLAARMGGGDVPSAGARAQIANATLRYMLEASPYRGAAQQVAEVFPMLPGATPESAAWTRDIRDALSVSSLPPAPSHSLLRQRIARNCMELHFLDRRSAPGVVGRPAPPPLSPSQRRAIARQLRSNISKLLERAHTLEES